MARLTMRRCPVTDDDGGSSRAASKCWEAYAGGRSLLCTVERGIVLVAAPRDDRRVVLRDAKRRRESTVVDLDATAVATQASLPWSIYPRTVVNRLARNFNQQLIGADIAISSSLPPAAGVSSSSALVVGLTLALSALSRLPDTERWREQLAMRTALAGCIRGRWGIGTDFGALTANIRHAGRSARTNGDSVLCTGQVGCVWMVSRASRA